MSLLTDLRAKTGASFVECRDALKFCNNDLLQAQGYLKFYDLAVRVKPKEGQSQKEAREEWLRKEIKAWADKQ